MEEMNNFEKVKFLRCPKCDGFTLEIKDPKNQKKLGLRCKNCNVEFILKGNDLINTNTERETEEPPAQEIKKPKIKKKSKFPSILITVIAVLIVIVIITKKNDKTQELIKKQPAQEVRKEVKTIVRGDKLLDKNEKSSTPKNAIANNSDNQSKKEQLPEKDKIKKENVVEEEPQQTEKTLPETKDELVIDKDTTKEIEFSTKIKNEKLPEVKEEEKKEIQKEEKKVVLEELESRNIIKVFNNGYIKVRSKSKDLENPRFRWYFKSKVVKISREEGQRVFIAGGPMGTEKWAVDNEIRINQKVIKGCLNSMKKKGIIPLEQRLIPYEITDLIPAGRTVTLTVHLADYGILWGNTPIYFVVKE